MSSAAALYKRSQTGRGERIETSLLEAQVAALVNIGQNYLSAGTEGTRWGTAHASIVPYQAFAAEVHLPRCLCRLRLNAKLH